MAAKPGFNIAILVTIIITVASTASARLLMKPADSSSTSSLISRLKLDEESSGYCWDSLIQLQHCTGELIMFFLNGETYIGPGCCRAIRTVGRKCWPTMLGVLGFTAQEGDMLQGYCDEHDSDDDGDDHSPPPPSSPPPSVLLKPVNVRAANP